MMPARASNHSPAIVSLGEPYTQPGLKWRPPACKAGVVATRPWVLWSLRQDGEQKLTQLLV